MIRVLMIAPTPFFSDRGCHVRIYEQARYLIDRGHSVSILTYPIGYDPPGLPVSRVSGARWYDRAEAGPAWPRLLLDLRVLIMAYKECVRQRPDLVHAHLHEGALIAAALKKRFGLPVIFDYQGSLTGESVQHGFIREGGALWRAFGRVEEAIDRSADRVVTSAGAMAALLRDKGIEALAVADGVDPKSFSPGPKDPDLMRKAGVPPGRPVAVYLGVLSRYQGTDVLLKASAIIRDQGEPVHFLVMGYPEDVYRKMAADMGLSGLVSFTGRVNYFEAARYLRLGDLALAPKLSSTESNGKVLNYMACGLPVAAFDLPVNREILGGHACWVEPSPDRDECAQGLAGAVLKLLKDRNLAENLASEGRKRAVEELSVERQGEALVEVYRRLLGEQG